MGRQTHSLRSSKWRYIQYFDGSEELYDMINDPNEYLNLANSKKYDLLKTSLRKHIPNDPDIKISARFESWKIVEEISGNILLFDLKTPPGLTETKNVAKDHPKLLRKIKEFLKNYKGTKNRIIIDEHQISSQ